MAYWSLPHGHDQVPTPGAKMRTSRPNKAARKEPPRYLRGKESEARCIGNESFRLVGEYHGTLRITSAPAVCAKPLSHYTHWSQRRLGLDSAVCSNGLIAIIER